jgi:hypothetical protein
MSTFEDRRRFFGDLDYVFTQAAAFHDFYASGAANHLSRDPIFQTVHNALLESSLSFLRKANEFFGGSRDIAAADFLPSIGKNWLFTKEDSTLLNDRVMHLSLEQAKHGKVDWAAFFERNLPEAQKRYSALLISLDASALNTFHRKAMMRRTPNQALQPTVDRSDG